MSYTYDVKSEILNNDIITNDEKTAELSAVLLSKNSFHNNKIELKLENISLAKRVYKFIKETTSLAIEVKYLVSKKLGEHNVYVICIPNQKGFKQFIQLINSFDVESILGNDHFFKGFIKGIFLSCGYIKDPKKEYALDFFMDDEETAEKFYNILQRKGKKVFKTQKRNKPLVYIRNSEDIMDIMVVIGSIQSFFKYEEMTMIKDLKNKTIREMNWEVANETKTLNTGNNQIKMIKYIDETVGLDSLSSVLQEISYVRLNNPESSLQEIADMIGISKSGVRNRFRRIEDTYNNLIKKEVEE